MKIIDLLNKIANGEEIPKKIKYHDDIYVHIDNYCYYCDETNLILSDRIFAEQSRLNDEVEIIEDIDSFIQDNKIDYKTRVDRAIKYINNFEYYIPEDNIPGLLEILKGE